jgi:hypothetical protein
MKQKAILERREAPSIDLIIHQVLCLKYLFLGHNKVKEAKPRMKCENYNTKSLLLYGTDLLFSYKLSGGKIQN